MVRRISPWLLMTTQANQITAHTIDLLILKACKPSGLIVLRKTMILIIQPLILEHSCLWKTRLSLDLRVMDAQLQSQPILLKVALWMGEEAITFMDRISPSMPRPTPVMCSITGPKTGLWFPICLPIMFQWQKLPNMWPTSSRWKVSSLACQFPLISISQHIVTIIVCRNRFIPLLKWVQ